MMLRIEAGLPLIDVEWHNSRTAFIDADRVTPKELGLGWMFPKSALLRTIAPSSGGTRSAASSPKAPRAGQRSGSWPIGPTGTGCTATPVCCRRNPSIPCRTSRCCTTPTATDPAGLRHQLHVLAGAPAPHRPRPGAPDMAAAGTELLLEVAIAHRNTTVKARTAKLPLFNPARKTAAE